MSTFSNYIFHFNGTQLLFRLCLFPSYGFTLSTNFSNVISVCCVTGVPRIAVLSHTGPVILPQHPYIDHYGSVFQVTTTTVGLTSSLIDVNQLQVGEAASR